MPLGFYLTNKGAEEVTKAIANGEKVNITKAAFGSGGVNGVDWDYAITALKSQFYEKTLSPDNDSYSIDPADPTQIEITTTVPNEVEGTINEIGFLDDEDNLIIYGVVNEKVKKKGEQGQLELLQYRNWVKLSNDEVENITINVNTLEADEVYKKLEEYATLEDLENVQIEKITDEEIQEIVGMPLEMGMVVGEPLSDDDVARLLDSDPSNDPKFDETSAGALSDSELDGILGG